MSVQAAEEPAQTDYRLETVISGGSVFHGVQGLRFDADDNLYAVSVIGGTVARVDRETGEVVRFVGPPAGMGDDIDITSDGLFVWTAIEDGIVWARFPDGTIKPLMQNQKGVNAISFSPDEQRLFVSLVFYGDALYELDVSGLNAPRLIAENLGGLNAFAVDHDGMIYGPVAGNLVKVDSVTGEIETLSTDFVRAGASKLVDEETLYVLDNGALDIKRVNIRTGETESIADIPESGDNMDVDSAGLIVYSIAPENALVEIDPSTNEWRYIVGPAVLNSASGLDVLSEDGMDTLILGDLFAGVKRIDPQSGEITDLRMDAPGSAQPSRQASHVSVSDDFIVVVEEHSGTVSLHRSDSFDVVRRYTGFNRPGDAVALTGGDILVVETGEGRVIRISGSDESERDVLLEGLNVPKGLVLSEEGMVYISESGAGNVHRVDLARGEIVDTYPGFYWPEGIDVDENGDLWVIDVQSRQISRVDPDSGEKELIAGNLPVGLGYGISLYRDIAVSPNAIYFNSDTDNAVYALKVRGPE